MIFRKDTRPICERKGHKIRNYLDTYEMPKREFSLNSWGNNDLPEQALWAFANKTYVRMCERCGKKFTGS